MNLIVHQQEWDRYKSNYIMTEDGAGMVRVTCYSEDQEACISDLYVQEDKRHQGIGRALIEEAKKQFQGLVKEHYLVVRKSNKNYKGLINFYESCGFKIDERGSKKVTSMSYDTNKCVQGKIIN